MKFHQTMPVKIALLSFVVAGIGVMLIGVSAYQNAHSILRQDSLGRLQDSLQRESVRLETSFQIFHEDALFLAESPSVQGILRTIASGDGYDEQENATETIWRQRLSTLFSTVLQQRAAYLSIRLILNSDGGREYVRIDKTDGQINESVAERLQQKGHRDYYQQTIRLQQGQVYFSPVNLNREHNRITMPLQPVIRFATPIVDHEGLVIGILIINADFQIITRSFSQSHSSTRYMMTNQYGDYLIHRDKDRTFGFEFNRPRRIQNDYPVQDFVTDSSNEETLSLDQMETEVGLALQKFHFDPLNPDRSMILAAEASLKILHQQSLAFRNKLILILLSAVFVISLLTSVLAYLVTRPLKELTLAADRIANGEEMEVPVHGNDEVGMLASSMQTMLHHLHNSREEVQELAISLEDKVRERTKDLALLNEELKEEIVEREKVEQDLRLASKYLEITQEALVITDPDGTILEVNDAFVAMAGYERDEILGKTPRVMKSGRHDKQFYQEMWKALLEQGHWQGEIWDRRKNGEIYPKWLSISAVRDQYNEISNFVALSTDITSIKETEEKLETLAHYDPLTGLANRLLFHDRLQHDLTITNREQGELGLILLDLDGFKEVNDTLGHPAGDQLLIMVASRLLDSIRESDTVARLGGDEFVIILTKIIRENDLALLAQKILDTLRLPYNLDGERVEISASLGITLYPEDGKDAMLLLKNADTAMYHAKAAGKGRIQFYTRAMTQSADARFRLAADLRMALKNEEFLVYYQPKVSLRNGRILGMEALVRWQHDGKIISPQEFIPVAEETGIITEIGAWVLHQACEQTEKWHKDFPDLRISVNLSGRQFSSRDLVERVAAVLQETGLEPSRLELEITETVIMSDVNATIESLWQLKNLGVILSVDDFGTGYSSLSYLKKFPLDVLKVDRSFVMDLTEDANDRAVVKAIVSLATQLKMMVIAEGVETTEQLAILQSIDCHEIQGYLVSPPVPEKEFYDFAISWEREKKYLLLGAARTY
jgi:diguanylate cyclase (GGDEF)-like protein/PAS domain S-box-containing protein